MAAIGTPRLVSGYYQSLNNGEGDILPCVGCYQLPFTVVTRYIMCSTPQQTAEVNAFDLQIIIPKRKSRSGKGLLNPLQLEQPVGAEQEVPLHQHRLPPPQQVQLQDLQDPQGQRQEVRHPGMNCIKIGLQGKLILSKRKGLMEVLFSRK